MFNKSLSNGLRTANVEASAACIEARISAIVGLMGLCICEGSLNLAQVYFSVRAGEVVKTKLAFTGPTLYINKKL
jgi:hypothetical protein